MSASLVVSRSGQNQATVHPDGFTGSHEYLRLGRPLSISHAAHIRLIGPPRATGSNELRPGSAEGEGSYIALFRQSSLYRPWWKLK